MGLFKKVGTIEILGLIKRAEALLIEEKPEEAYEIIKTIEDNNGILKNTQLKLRLYRLREDYCEYIIQENCRLGHRQ